MEIAEAFSIPKSKDKEKNEDGFFASGDFVAVVDGATSKSKEKLFADNRTSGRIATDLLIGGLKSLPKDATAAQAMLYLNEILATWYKENNLYQYLQDNPVDRPTASIVIYSKHRNELWMLGDCQALIDGEHITNVKKVDGILGRMRARHLQQELDRGKTIAELQANDTGRQQILHLLRKQYRYQNVDNRKLSYYVLDGFFTQTAQIKIVPVAPDSEVVLASDGLLRLRSTFDKSIHESENVINADPLLIQEAATKSPPADNPLAPDDITFVRFKVTQAIKEAMVPVQQ